MVKMRQLHSTLFYLSILLTHSALDEGNDGTHVKSSEKTEPIGPKNDIHNIYDRKSYQVLLKTMRQHQSMAVKSMFAVTDNKRLNSLLTDVLSKMKKVLEKSKKVVEEAKFTPSNEVFPTEDPLRESVAKIVENTAFFFELTVSLPDHMDRLTYKNTETKSLMTWCFEFTQKMDIYDKETADIILSGARELLIVPRPKGHKNPNRKIYMKNMKQQEAFEAYQKMLEHKEASKKSEAKLKPKKEAGPKLTRAEL